MPATARREKDTVLVFPQDTLPFLFLQFSSRRTVFQSYLHRGFQFLRPAGRPSNEEILENLDRRLRRLRGCDTVPGSSTAPLIPVRFPLQGVKKREEIDTEPWPNTANIAIPRRVVSPSAAGNRFAGSSASAGIAHGLTACRILQPTRPTDSTQMQSSSDQWGTGSIKTASE